MTRLDVAIEGVETQDGRLILWTALRMPQEEAVPVTMHGEVIGRAQDLRRTTEGVVSLDFKILDSYVEKMGDLTAYLPTISLHTLKTQEPAAILTIADGIIGDVHLTRDWGLNPWPSLIKKPKKNKREKETSMSLKKLKKAAKKRTDDFADGTVVRWTSSDRYTYAAIRTPVGWYTTARAGNPFVKQVIDFEDLLDIVARAETTNVEVATDTGWEKVG